MSFNVITIEKEFYKNYKWVPIVQLMATLKLRLSPKAQSSLSGIYSMVDPRYYTYGLWFEKYECINDRPNLQNMIYMEILCKIGWWKINHPYSPKSKSSIKTREPIFPIYTVLNHCSMRNQYYATF